MSISYFCNACENEDDFIIKEGSIHCTACQSNDVEIIKDGPPFADEINEDLFLDPFETLDDYYE